jgi:predicted TIM-barrel fold metal-dependent hydrolase
MSRLMVVGLVAVAGSALVGVSKSAVLAQPSRSLPIIDMHLHANGADDNGPPPTYVCPGFERTAHDPRLSWEAAFGAMMKTPPCANPIKGAETDEALMKSTFEILERRNIFAVTSGSRLERWRAAGNRRIIPAAMFNLGPNAPSVATLRDGFAAKRYMVFGEVGIQYQGVSPSDPRFEPYLAVAEAADVPLAIHIGIGPPGAPYFQGLGNYRARLHSPLELEEALVRHPKLRVYIMHAGWPMLDDLLAVLWTHPQVNVDVGAIAFALSRKEFHRYLERIVDAGFGSRVMFGSDQMNWPGVIEHGIEAIASATFLTPAQKRDILYNNAARFLRFTQDEIASHHGG